ncbi:MAG: nitrate reductase molybdenum cofactor assembly chaperone, partial [Deltaproteobacteria bacterium]
MNEVKRSLLKVLSILLQYPEDEIIIALGELREVAQGISQVEHRRRCMNFLHYLENNPLFRLQGNYTATFDFNPATSLNLTYHKWGDARERGNALLGFHQLYATAGYEITDRELPDYLPMFLEFLSIHYQECDFSFFGHYLVELKAISALLEESDSPYGPLFEIVLDIFRELKINGA